ncbi:hypothetical protein EG328_009872 [Venturia inaequalis]|uniref:C2H2-type domain-containing protein n=1 Tax=Venturia inaequalis TaxID=5025 RepID=A0A8H3Z7P1_VENIN|nr:hypothetical protein EG328_009872 [Venturia inaequalis]
MDDSAAYHLNGLAGSQPQYSAQQHQSQHPHPQQQQQQQNPTARRFPEGGQESNTLPPINGLANNTYAMYNQNGSMLPGSAPASMPHTPITPHSTLGGGASSAPPDANFPPQTLQHHRPIGPPYPQQYQTSQSIAAAPSSSLAAAPPYGAPLAARGQQYAPHLLAHSQQMKQEPEPTHVVGQQGRRGILPSAPGRAAPQAGKTAIPTKDKDGKFPCPHCTKTYLHAKHLKRHMLRHTGDRPYQCKLCKDTFSRSDILKRHYQKCSIRRGVPNDTNHLEGSRNHLVKNNNNSRLSNGSIGDQQHSYLNGAPQQQATFDPSLNSHHLMMNPVNQYVQNGGVYANANDMAALSNRSSRANSLMSPANNRFDGQQQDFANQGTLAQMAPGVQAYAPTSNAYGYPVAVTAGEMNGNHQVRAGESNGIFKQEQPSLSQWNSGYQNNGGENYQSFPAGPVGGSQNLLDTKPDLAGSGQGGVYTNLYGTSSNFATNQMFTGWNLGDPFDAKAAALVAFCFADGAPSSPNEIAVHNRLREILTADNIKRYLRLFRNFQGHWPIIHMPTFSTIDANNGLLLAMVTVGAVYADDLGLDEVRWLMELAKNAVHRSSHIFNSAALMDATHRIQPAPSDIEEIQTLALLQTIFIWHGNKQQRAKAREEFCNIAKIARQIGLLYPIPPDQPGFSPLHSTTKGPVHAANLDWQAWVEQEKRSRAMFVVYLLDCALVIFFNCSPNFNSSELRLQLPCDDGAWEAPNPDAWKDSIGLHGHPAQANTNQTGSKSVSQPDFSTSVRVLLSQNTTIAPGSTNVYGKFILIHALLVKVAMPAVNTVPSGANTPLSQYDWVAHASPQQGGPPDSGRVTPSEGFVQSQQAQQAHFHKQHLMTVQFGFEKWKQAWDKDMDSQYPSAGSPNGRGNVRREGFCRDAIHFYYLGRNFISHNANFKGYAEADQRVAYVMATLKAIRTHVAQEGDRQGIELGSVVDIDESYGVDDLRLDMKLFFAPLSLDVGTEAQAINQNGGQMRLMQRQQL